MRQLRVRLLFAQKRELGHLVIIESPAGDSHCAEWANDITARLKTAWLSVHYGKAVNGNNGQQRSGPLIRNAHVVFLADVGEYEFPLAVVRCRKNGAVDNDLQENVRWAQLLEICVALRIAAIYRKAYFKLYFAPGMEMANVSVIEAIRPALDANPIRICRDIGEHKRATQRRSELRRDPPVLKIDRYIRIVYRLSILPDDSSLQSGLSLHGQQEARFLVINLHRNVG